MNAAQVLALTRCPFPSNATALAAALEQAFCSSCPFWASLESAVGLEQASPGKDVD